MRTRHAISLIAGLLLMGCTGLGANNAATRESMTTATATVEAIDQSTRNVTLRDDNDGSTISVTAGPEVRNLDQVKAGDHVQIQFYQSVTASMADPADTGEAQTAVLAGRAPEGAKPGAMAAATDSMVVTLITYNADTGLASFRTPDGLTRRAIVPPELRSFAAARGPGSRVLVTMTRAMAVSVTEAPSTLH